MHLIIAYAIFKLKVGKILQFGEMTRCESRLTGKYEDQNHVHDALVQTHIICMMNTAS